MVRASVSIGWVAMAGHDDFSAQRFGPGACSVEIVYLEPKKQTVSRWHVVRVADLPVMMFHVPAVQLHHEPAGMDEAFVGRPAMIALAVEQPSTPSAAGLDIPNANQRLWS